ncbi:sigma-70 family RNA polymerase sigma factor [uncultured Ilyobacter sp.]|uniref:RNA polymerase sigma factor n=1 Tax=uncultured Ilyobacter sp. TaxID=544433 RepID=UPI0029F4A624|nr:sigma-70 family RNA polymerase sigma factor [uncultured Ilyobacter sp.]
MTRDGQSARGHWLRAALEQYERPLLAYAARLVNSTDLARDVVQDTFIRLCAADRRQVGDHLGPWLFRVCRNRALDLRRKEKRMRRLNDPATAAGAGYQPPPGVALESRESTTQALQLVAALPERQQEAVRLRFQGGLSYKEIAEVLGISVTNVGVTLHTAIKTIREQMGLRPSADGESSPASGRIEQ